MNPLRFLAALGLAVTVTVAGALSLTYAVDRKAAREHAAYRAGRGR